jgi:hypothetical protein
MISAGVMRKDDQAVSMSVAKRGTLAIALAALACAVAFGGEIAEPDHGVKFDYDETRWEAKIDDGAVLLECHADACGGETAECQGTTADNKSGRTNESYFASFLDTYTDEIVNGFAHVRTKPVVVDRPARFMEDGVLVGLSSIRYTLDGKQRRAWIALISAQFGLIVLQCDASEERFVDAQPKWLDLVKMLGKAKT